jgi:hypothetical protein
MNGNGSSTPQKQKGNTNSMKRPKKTVTPEETLWVTEKNFSLRLDGAMRMPLNKLAIENARRFCLCEMARRVQLRFEMRPANWWTPVVDQYRMEANAEQRQIVDSYTIDLQARIAEAVKQSVNPPAPAGKRRRGNKESTEASGLLPMTGEIEQQVRKTLANMVADAAKPISRTLTTGELYDVLWSNRALRPEQMAPAKPSEILESWPLKSDKGADEPERKRVNDGETIWRAVLNERKIFSSDNLERAVAWALNSGFEFLKKLDVESHRGLAYGDLVHRDAIIKQSEGSPEGTPNASDTTPAPSEMTAANRE